MKYLKIYEDFSINIHTSEFELIELAKKGNEKAKSIIYKKYRKDLYKVCLNKEWSKDEQEITIIVNNALIRALNKMNLYTNKGSFRGFLLIILKNSAADFFKAKKLKDKELYKGIENEDTQDNNNDSEFNIKVINKFLKSGRLTDKEVIFLETYLKLVKHKDIAISIGVTEGTSKWYLNEVTKKLKKWVDDIKLKHKNWQDYID